jgi:acyl carrier protein
MTTQVPVPTTQELLEDLRHICAEIVEIPIDKITVDADLAADLGVDSLTQDELFDKVLTRYGLSAVGNSVQATSYPTIGAIADLIQQLNGEGDGGKNSGADD